MTEEQASSTRSSPDARRGGRRRRCGGEALMNSPQGLVLSGRRAGRPVPGPARGRWSAGGRGLGMRQLVAARVGAGTISGRPPAAPRGLSRSQVRSASRVGSSTSRQLLAGRGPIRARWGGGRRAERTARVRPRRAGPAEQHVKFVLHLSKYSPSNWRQHGVHRHERQLRAMLPGLGKSPCFPLWQRGLGDSQDGPDLIMTSIREQPAGVEPVEQSGRTVARGQELPTVRRYLQNATDG